MAAKKTYTFGRAERLKSRKAIEYLFREGKRFTITPFRVHYCLMAGKGLLTGTGASTRNFKKAVDRNRIKRLTKEAWRLQKNPLKEKLDQANRGLHLFLIYTGKELPDYKQVFESVKIIADKLYKLVEA
ncbi:MAG: ribonuclease P protein component [Chitinophagaceae bacterium]